MNDAKQGAVPTAPQSLTLLCDYIAYYAPHTADCMSRVPFALQRGFNKRDCDCTLRAAKEHVRIVRESTAQLLAERDALLVELAACRGALERAMAVLIPMVDVGQRRLNGGPYCIHVEGDGFCGRAEPWDGHHLGDKADWPGHPFTDGEWLAEAALSRAAKREEG